MKRTLWTSAILAAFLLAGPVACKDKKKKNADPPADTVAKPTEPGDAETKPKIPKRVPMASSVEQIKSCWKAASDKDDEGIASCYADKAVFELVDSVPERKAEGGEAALEIIEDMRRQAPDLTYEIQLLLVNDPAIVTVVHAKNDKVSMFSAQVGQLDKDGRFERDLHYFDQATLMHQLGARKSKTAPDSETPWSDKVEVIADKKDESLARKLVRFQEIHEVIKSGDAKKVADVYADDAVLRYAPEATPRSGKAEIEKAYAAYFALSPTLQTTALRGWVAGDWVIAETLVRGNTAQGGASFAVRQAELFQLADGKIKQHWVFGNRLKFDADVGLYKPDAPGE